MRSIHHNLVMSRHGSRHFFITLPRVLLQRREGSNKKYFAYEIQITPISGDENSKWSLLRRYSEFHRLHKYLQISNPMIKTLDFPPKKSFGNMVCRTSMFFLQLFQFQIAIKVFLFDCTILECGICRNATSKIASLFIGRDQYDARSNQMYDSNTIGASVPIF